jgi:hypothetical protein
MLTYPPPIPAGYKIPLGLPLLKGEAYVSPFDKGGLRGISTSGGLLKKNLMTPKNKKARQDLKSPKT